MRRMLFTLALLCMLCTGAAGETDFYTEMPPLLRFTQETIRQEVAPSTRAFWANGFQGV